MSPEVSVYIEDIRSECENIEKFTSNMSFEKFMQDPKTQRAVVRCLEVIGEAAKRIPNETRALSIREALPAIQDALNNPQPGSLNAVPIP